MKKIFIPLSAALISLALGSCSFSTGTKSSSSVSSSTNESSEITQSSEEIVISSSSEESITSIDSSSEEVPSVTSEEIGSSEVSSATSEESSEEIIESSEEIVSSEEIDESSEESIESSDEPIESSEESIESSDEPIESSEEPIESSEEPIESSEEPIESSEEPIDSSEEPIESSEEPIESSDPIDSSEEPIESSEVPVESSEESIESSEQPVESSEQPVESSEKPVESSEIVESSESSSEEVSSEATITFSAKGTNNSEITSLVGMYEFDGVSVSSITPSKAYYTEGSYIRLGSSKNNGTLAINFAENIVVKELSIKAAKYGSDSSKLNATVGSTTTSNITISSSSASYYNFGNFEDEGEIDSIKITSSKRVYIYEIKLVLGAIEPVYPTSISLAPSDFKISIGGKKKLSVNYSPANTNIKDVSFDSKDSSIATVDEDGNVTGISVGTTTIEAIATAAGGSIVKSSSTVTVEEATPAEEYIEEIKYTYDDYTANNSYELDSCPTDDGKLLVIPVWFSDSSTFISTSKKASVKSDIEKAYFGTKEETGWNSVKSYYEEESLNSLTLNGTVSDWYETGTSYSQYANESSGGQATMSLVSTATDWYFQNNKSESRKDYDRNGDGYLDGVMLIYAAPDYSVLGNQNYSNLWAYCYWLQDEGNKSVATPGPNTFFWASYDFMYGSNTVSSHTGKSSSYYSGDTRYCNIDAHTYIHEMGHVFGLEDYYDYGDGRYNPAGGFSMQDYNVGGHDPYSVMAYGWANPYVPTESCEITLNPFVSSHDLILLTPSWNGIGSPFDEYLLLELYTPTGLNELDSTYSYCDTILGATKTGIRLWHVDARLAYSTSLDSEGYPAYSASKLTTNPSYNAVYGVYHAFSNTYDDADYGSILGSSYYKYDLLHLIRNDTSLGYKTTSTFGNSSLFADGSSFKMSSYASQFPNSGKLDSGKTLGWNFSVSITGSGENAKATINLVKE